MNLISIASEEIIVSRMPRVTPLATTPSTGPPITNRPGRTSFSRMRPMGPTPKRINAIHGVESHRVENRLKLGGLVGRRFVVSS